MDGSNKIMAGVGRNVETVSKVKTRIREVPVGKRGARKQRRTNGKVL